MQRQLLSDVCLDEFCKAASRIPAGHTGHLRQMLAHSAGDREGIVMVSYVR